MEQEPTLETRRIHEGRVLNLRVDTVRLPSGKTALREIVEHSGAVTIVPVDEDGNLLLVRQYRKAAGESLLRGVHKSPLLSVSACPRPPRPLFDETHTRHWGIWWRRNIPPVGGCYFFKPVKAVWFPKDENAWLLEFHLGNELTNQIPQLVFRSEVQCMSASLPIVVREGYNRLLHFRPPSRLFLQAYARRGRGTNAPPPSGIARAPAPAWPRHRHGPLEASRHSNRDGHSPPRCRLASCHITPPGQDCAGTGSDRPLRQAGD